MKQNLSAVRVGVATLASALSVGLLGCKDEVPNVVVFDAAPATATPQAVDLSTCRGCQLMPQSSWAFQGVYRDSECSVPLAQALVPACATVPTLSAVSLAYTDAVGSRKAGDSGQVTLTEAIAPDAIRFRKAGTDCVAANEVATDVAPTCAGGKACRNPAGAIACDGCQNLADGCPEYVTTRAYASFDDPELKMTATGGGRSNSGLAACCNALAAEGKRLGASPEGGLLLSAAAQCTALVAQGKQGVEFAAIKSMLGGRAMPKLCAGL